tara:strand:- start:4608 stop:5312 length:705 start_codon:yes stop_codon:yes gene_type:complete
MQQSLQQKKGLVQTVFNKVFDKYDLMNDLMSLGIHRSWKNNLIKMMNPSQTQSLIDVGCGTGDIGKLFAEVTKNKGEVTCLDPNTKMLEKGKERLKNFPNINWKIGHAEKLTFPDNYFDFYVISFGLRNTKNINKSISEAYRVLKKGGRFFCLEFSKIENSNLQSVYKIYSKLIPKIGKVIVGDDKPYNYLIKSIDKFINQNQLIEILKRNNFENCKYRNLNGGIVAIHSGWKI